MNKLPNITGLRFLLALLVVIFHVSEFCQNRGFPFYNDFAFLNKGSEAVYMFFSLSGFLIIRQLYMEKSISNSVNLLAFFKRRALRIFPLYYLVLTFGFIYYRTILPFLGFDFESNYDLLSGLLLSFTFFVNIFIVEKPGGIIEVLWSIAIEEQFYLLIAPLIYFIPFKYIFRFLVLFTILCFLLFFSDLTDLFRNYSMLFFYFSFSGLCSILTLNLKFKLSFFKYFVFVIFIIYFTTSIFRDNLTDIYYHLLSMILFGLTLTSLVDTRIMFLENKLLNHLGKISYGIYMFHAIMMQLVGFIFLKSNIHLKLSNSNSIIIFNFSVLISTIFLAHLSYKYFESYFLNLKSKTN